MTVDKEHYYCEICGIVVSVLQGGSGTLVCCGQDMTKITAQKAAELSKP